MTGALLQSQTIEFFVPGKPATQGSKKAIPHRHTGKPILIEDKSSDHAKWRDRAASYAKAAYSGPLMRGPVELSIRFVRPRPKGHFGTGRNAGVLKLSAPQYPTTAPDASKQTRALEDALKHIIWQDDAQVVDQHVSKRYGDEPGAYVKVVEL